MARDEARVARDEATLNRIFLNRILRETATSQGRLERLARRLGDAAPQVQEQVVQAQQALTDVGAAASTEIEAAEVAAAQIEAAQRDGVE